MVRSNLVRRLCRRPAKPSRCIFSTTWIPKWRRCARRWLGYQATRNGPTAILHYDELSRVRISIWTARPKAPAQRQGLRKPLHTERLSLISTFEKDEMCALEYVQWLN